MNLPLPTLLLPLFSAMIYALAAVHLKNAMRHGAGPWRVTFVANVSKALLALCFIPLGFEPIAWGQIYQPLLAGLLFFLGQILTFLALAKGDVSVATPMLGTKTVMVALFSFFIFGTTLPLAWVLGAVLTAVAVALLGSDRFKIRREMWPTLLLAWASACSFAMTDLLVQEWTPAWGAGGFLPIMFGFSGLLSLGMLPFFRSPIYMMPAPARFPFWLGSFLISLQAMGMALALGLYGHATAANIVYSSRGLWSILLVWLLGRLLQNSEATAGGKIMFRRLIGSLLIIAAIILVVSG